MRVYEGHLTDAGGRYGIIVSRFNSLITGRLLDGALDALRRHGVTDDRIDVYWVPGSFEVPVLLKRLVTGGGYDALVTLACVIRGGTPHFDYVSNEITKGVAQISMAHAVPVGFGVLTCDTVEQAIDRAGVKSGNKGAEAALAALEMLSLFQRMGT